jgi:hypothetical protein
VDLVVNNRKFDLDATDMDAPKARLHTGMKGNHPPDDERALCGTSPRDTYLLEISS